MPGAFQIGPDRSAHPDLGQRIVWAIQVPTIVHLEREHQATWGVQLASLGKVTRAGLGTVCGRKASLGQAVEDATQDAQNFVQRHSPLPSRSQQGVESFLKALQQLNCDSCAGGQGDERQICRHDPFKDHKIVEDPSNQPVCLRFVTETFEKLLGRAEQFYRSLAGTAGPNLTFTLALVQKAGAQVEAETSFPQGDCSRARFATIEVTLPVDLNAAAIGALPYVLCHEVFVHGLEQWAQIGKRTPTPSTCSLREGFVDAAATHYSGSAC